MNGTTEVIYWSVASALVAVLLMAAWHQRATRIVRKDLEDTSALLANAISKNMLLDKENTLATQIILREFTPEIEVLVDREYLTVDVSFVHCAHNDSVDMSRPMDWLGNAPFNLRDHVGNGSND